MHHPHRTRAPIANPTRRTPSPSAVAEAELRWFFNEAEIAADLPSNFQALLAGASPTSLESVERRAEAMHAARKIQERLARLSPAHAVLLAGFFTARPWSGPVARALPGGLAGAARVSPQLLAAYVGAPMRAGNVTDFVEETVATAPAAGRRRLARAARGRVRGRPSRVRARRSRWTARGPAGGRPMKGDGRSGRSRSGLQVRVFYSVAELARAGNVPTYRLLRLLQRNGVTFLRAGRAYYVLLDEIRRRIPPLWRSLRAAEDLRRRSERGSE